MSFYRADVNRIDHTQGRLLRLAALFLGLLALSLSLAPAVRARSWDVELVWRHWLGYAIWVFGFAFADRETRRRLPARDPYLLPISALICGWGLLTIWRVAPNFGLRQSLWLFVALGIFTAGLRLPSNLRLLREYKYLWLTSGLILTGMTLLFGTNPSGAGPRLWLGCCGVYFQPSELLKLLLIVYLAAYLADRQFLIPALLPLLIPSLIMTGITILLLLVQRDLGTASIFLLLYTAVIFYATGRKRVLVISLLTLLLAGIAGYVMFDVVRVRIEAWINPWQDPSGRSYQIVQSLLGIAAGGLLGRGPGLGNPTVVPVNHSDFIFSSIAEESGLIGALALITLLAIFTARGLGTALAAGDNYRRYLAVGLTAYIAMQSTLIMGGNMRLFPLTGVTLPFVSYGGSSLVISFLALLLLLQISAAVEADPAHLHDIQPIQIVGGLMLAGLMSVAWGTGWWAIYRGPDLLTRTDNPRRAIDDRTVRRGTLFGQSDVPLNLTQGAPGEFFRAYQYPALSPALGYNHPFYGQAGAERDLDVYLRGLAGYPDLTLWWNHLLYGQPPPGLDVRLSLNLDLQRVVDDLLADRQAALVLMNAKSGEIRALSSHPTFDANQLEDHWERLIQDPQAPLLNRVTLGQYQPGSALGPLLLAAVLAERPLLDLTEQLGIPTAGMSQGCALPLTDASWQSTIVFSCQAAIANLGRQIGAQDILELYTALGFFASPTFHLETIPPVEPPSGMDPGALALGENLRLSPLQVGIAIAALSAGGERPAPQLVTGIRAPGGKWQPLSALSRPTRIFTPEIADRVTALLASDQDPIWQTLAVVPQEESREVTWFLGGTRADRKGIPLVIALVLEENNPALARQIGQTVLRTAMNP